MKRKIILGSVLLFTVVFSFSFTFLDDDDDFELIKNMEIFHNVMRQLRVHYVEKIDSRFLITDAIEKMLDNLDPYTVFFPASESESIYMMSQARYVGVGISIDSFDNHIYIVDVEDDGSANENGVQVGDMLIKVNGISLDGKHIDEIHNLMSGDEGGNVKITVKRNDKVLDFDLKRKNVDLSVVSLVKNIDGIGYIKLENFSNKSAYEFRKALIDLRKQKIKGLIIDLRGNPGGLLDQAVEIVNFFIPKDKVVVTSKGKSEKANSVFYTQKSPVDTKLPVVVLVNSHSASASEIVAGTLQDYDRAVVIGTQTYGKGLVQQIFDVGYNSKLKVTVSKYYIPSGRCIQAIDYYGEKIDTTTKFFTANGRIVYEGKGITPDIVIKQDTLSDVLNFLINRHWVFYYCNYRFNNMDTAVITNPENYRFADKDDFVAYLKKMQFFNDLPDIKNLTEMSDKYDNSAVKNDIDVLQQEIVRETLSDIDKNFDDLSVFISKGLVKRKYLHSGEVVFGLYNDVEIKRAMTVLKNEDLYNSILHK